MTQEERWAVWRKTTVWKKRCFARVPGILQAWDPYHMLRYFHCVGTSQPELPLPSVWERNISKVWFICRVSDISFSTWWIAQSAASSYLLTIKGVQDKVQCSYLQKEHLRLLRLIPFPISGFQVTNIVFKLTSSVLWSIKLGLRLTQMIDTVSWYSGINQENCAYNWRPSYLFGVYEKNTVAFHIIHLIIVIKKGVKQHKHGEKEIHINTQLSLYQAKIWLGSSVFFLI